MQGVKNLFGKIFSERFYNSLVMKKRKIIEKHYLFHESFRIFMKKVQCLFNKDYRKVINNGILKVNEYKDKDYIIFHNPKFMGVTSATKELFENLVPIYDLYYKKDINKIAKIILNSNIKSVYFSSFCYGWGTLVKKLKKGNPNLVIKTFSHGSHSQVIDIFGWNRMTELIKLHKIGLIDQMATCKASLMPFYEYIGFDSIFLNNTVTFNGDKYKSKTKNKKIKIGLYSANGDWRKNMMTQVASCKLIKNATIDMVPLNKEAKRFADSINVKMDGLPKALPRDGILERMAKNDVNIYVTFSECAPMMPIESLEIGVPCISGNNHHFFKGTELEKYLIVNNETDVFEIQEKIELCIKEKDKILKIYKDWKKKNDLNTKKQVKLFLGGKKHE